uniref:Mesencephalic astrocyte-derived neurotrophic factor homolog n=1 Tax=Timema bartmani TaxID=61472 RepID=A0A7R9F1Q6_9NEOP|nr:unnamed protein product [Timema bartmani]
MVWFVSDGSIWVQTLVRSIEGGYSLPDTIYIQRLKTVLNLKQPHHTRNCSDSKRVKVRGREEVPLGANSSPEIREQVKEQVKEGFGNQINLCRDRGLNPGPSAQKSDTLPLDHQVTVGLPDTVLLIKDKWPLYPYEERNELHAYSYCDSRHGRRCEELATGSDNLSHKMKPCSPQLLPVTVVLATLFLGSVLSLKKEDCEVCITVVERFSNSLSPEVKSDTKKIENEFRDFCKALKNKENRFCYYLGGMEDSATGILGELSKPLSWSLPADKICEKLKKMDNQICDLRYDKTIDLKTVELKKLKVRDLRKILNDWDEVCEGCIEKTDFIKRIEELKPLYVREEL